MSVTRRGSLLAAGAVSTALIVRPPTIPAPPEEVIEAEIIEDLEFPASPHRVTRLELFLKSRGIKPAHLATESGYSRQHLLRLRMGRVEATRKCIACLVVALRRMTRERITASDLFDLERA